MRPTARAPSRWAGSSGTGCARPGGAPTLPPPHRTSRPALPFQSLREHHARMETALATNLITRVTVGDGLTRTAGRMPEKLALVDCERRWTYAELNAWTNRVANGLLGLGYSRGDALALAAGNSGEFMATYLACAKIGVVCVPLNLGWRSDEIAYVLDHSEARGVVIEAQLVAAVLPGVEKVPAVQDVIVAYGTDGQYEQTLPDRTWLTF